MPPQQPSVVMMLFALFPRCQCSVCGRKTYPHARDDGRFSGKSVGGEEEPETNGRRNTRGRHGPIRNVMSALAWGGGEGEIGGEGWGGRGSIICIGYDMNNIVLVHPVDVFS